MQHIHSLERCNIKRICFINILCQCQLEVGMYLVNLEVGMYLVNKDKYVIAMDMRRMGRQPSV